MSKMRRILSGGEDGFTLIELLVVIAVLGILAAIAIPRLGGVTNKARLSEATSFASSLRSAQEMYYVENNNQYYTGGSTTLGALGTYIDEDSFPTEWTVNYGGTTSSYAITISQGGVGSVEATPGGVTSTPASN